MNNESFISQLESNYTKVFNYTGGHPNIQTCVSIATQYTLADKVYSGVELQKIIDAISDKQPLYSPFWAFRTNAALLPKVASYLYLSEDVNTELQKARKGVELLEEGGFKKSDYRSLASFFVEDTAHVVRVKNLHQHLKKLQPFLTRSSDLPYLVLLTRDSEGQEQLRAQSIQVYYKALQKLDFKTGDALQALAQLLTLYKVEYVEQLALYVQQLKKEFEARGLKMRRKYYPYLGVLAIRATDTAQVEQIVELVKALDQSKSLQGAKDLAFMIAVQKFMHEHKATSIEDATMTRSTIQEEWLYVFMDLVFYFPGLALEGIESILDFDFSI